MVTFFQPSPEVIFIDFRSGGRGAEYINVRNVDWLPPIQTLTRDEIHNLDMCPNQGLNPQSFGAWDDVPTN